MRTLMVAGPREQNLGSNIFRASLMIWDFFASTEEKFRVVHGDASGVDRIAAMAAKSNGHTVVPYRINDDDRRKAGSSRRAPLYRTMRIFKSEQPDIVVAWWDGKSAGTGFTIDKARKLGIPVQIYSIEEDRVEDTAE